MADVKMEYTIIPPKRDPITGDEIPGQKILNITTPKTEKEKKAKTKKTPQTRKRKRCTDLGEDECGTMEGCIFQDGKCQNKEWSAENCPLMTIADSKNWLEKLRKWETETILVETCENLDYKACGAKSECKWGGWTRWTGKCIPKAAITELAEMNKQIANLPCIIKNLRMKEDLSKDEAHLLDWCMKTTNELTDEIKKHAVELENLIKMRERKKELEEQMKEAKALGEMDELHLLEHEHTEIVTKMKEQQTSWLGLIKKYMGKLNKKWIAVLAVLVLGYAIFMWGPVILAYLGAKVGELTASTFATYVMTNIVPKIAAWNSTTQVVAGVAAQLIPKDSNWQYLPTIASYATSFASSYVPPAELKNLEKKEGTQEIAKTLEAQQPQPQIETPPHIMDEKSEKMWKLWKGKEKGRRTTEAHGHTIRR